MTKTKNPAAVALGRLGGQSGGRARWWASLTDEARAAILAAMAEGRRRRPAEVRRAYARRAWEAAAARRRGTAEI